MGNNNESLHKSRQQKNDEFYTRYEDINSEINTVEHGYRKHFENTVVYCNCDDPEWSSFWKFFKDRFKALKLKKLVSTHFEKSGGASYMLTYDGEKTTKEELEGNGDFNSPECIELLKAADIVVTNPPFSLFKEYLAQLMEYEKKFIIIGTQNAITYKEIFPLLKENKIWLGYHNGHTLFGVPDDYDIPENYKKEDKAKSRSNGYIIDKDGKIWRNLGNICWYTNLDIPKRHEPIKLGQKFDDNKSLYSRYDKYDAINCDKVSDIPCDYNGTIGVPITFLLKHCPEQFEIVGTLVNGSAKKNTTNKNIYDYEEPFVNKKKLYARILIRRIANEN